MPLYSAVLYGCLCECHLRLPAYQPGDECRVTSAGWWTMWRLFGYKLTLLCLAAGIGRTPD